MGSSGSSETCAEVPAFLSPKKRNEVKIVSTLIHKLEFDRIVQVTFLDYGL